MIIVSDHPKKRFDIANKFALYQKQIKSKHGKNIDHVFNHLDNEYETYIANLKTKLATLQHQYDELKDEDKKDVNLDELAQQILTITNQITDLESKHLSSLHNTTVSMQNVKYEAKTIRLGSLYKIDKLWIKMSVVAMLGIVVACAVWLLVQYTGVYTSGVSGLIQGIAKIVKIKIEDMGSDYANLANTVYNALFWGLYFFINIPLIIFAYFKVNKQFAILSATYLIFAQGVGYGLGFINNGSGIYIFTNMAPSASLVANSNYIQGVQMLPWNINEGLVFGLFTYSLVYSAIAGMVFSVIYVLGASSGGLDFVGFYYSKVKNKAIGNILIIFSITSLVIGVILGSFICWLLKAVNDTNITLNVTTILEAFFSPNLIASVLGAIITGIIYNYFFPRNKVIKVQVYSEKVDEVALELISNNWNYKLLLTQDKENVLSDQNMSRSLETICFYIDIPTLISTIRSIDTEGLITIYSTFGFDGELPTSSYER